MMETESRNLIIMKSNCLRRGTRVVLVPDNRERMGREPDLPQKFLVAVYEKIYWRRKIERI